MACTKGYVTTGASQPTIHLCVTTNSMDVNASLEGVRSESWPFVGYVKFSLYREATNSDAWTHVATLNGGYWANSSAAKKNITFRNIGQPGKTMRVVAAFYYNSNYTDSAGSISHIFLR